MLLTYRSKLLAYVSVLLILLLTTLIHSYYSTRNIILLEAQKRFEYSVQLVKNNLSAEWEELQRYAAIVKDDQRLKEYIFVITNFDSGHDVLPSLYEKNFGWLPNDREIILTTNGEIILGRNNVDLMRAIKRRLPISEPFTFTFEGDDGLELVTGLPLIYQDKNLAVVALTKRFDATWLSRKRSEGIGQLVVENNAKIELSTEESLTGKHFKLHENLLTVDNVIYQFYPIPLPDKYPDSSALWFGVNVTDVIKALDDYTTKNIYKSFIGILIVLLIGWVITKNYHRPLSELTRITREIAQGKRPYIEKLNAQTEVQLLQNQYADMLDALRRKENEVKSAEQQRVALTASLKQEQEFLRAVLDNIEDGIAACDANGKLILFNPALCKFQGYTLDDPIKNDWIDVCDLYTPDKQTLLKGKKNPLLRALSEEELKKTELLLIPKNKKQRTVVVSSQYLTDVEDKKLGAVVSLHDITKRKESEKKLLNRRDHLEELVAQRTAALEVTRDRALSASKAKSRFLANMSHELRTPLNAIIGYSELLTEDAHKDGLQSYADDLKKVNEAGKHLLAIINDILDLSKIEAGKVELNLEHFPLCGLIADIENTVELLAKRNSNKLTFQCRSTLGRMYGDVTKIRQMLFNLLSNACKFTKDGEIKLFAERRTIDGTEMAVLKVEDSGIGISSSQLNSLFEPFTQAEMDINRKYGGTGLGLTISKLYCNRMGGEIVVQSSLGKGSTFTAYIPMNVADE